jgi:hypothetical protein
MNSIIKERTPAKTVNINNCSIMTLQKHNWDGLRSILKDRYQKPPVESQWNNNTVNSQTSDYWDRFQKITGHTKPEFLSKTKGKQFNLYLFF